MSLSTLDNLISMKKWWLPEKTWESNSETNERKRETSSNKWKVRIESTASFRHTKPGHSVLCTPRRWERANGYWHAVLMDRAPLFLLPHPTTAEYATLAILFRIKEKQTRELWNTKKYGIREGHDHWKESSGWCEENLAWKLISWEKKNW